jgi:polysaccharide biosynthesis protein PslH
MKVLVIGSRIPFPLHDGGAIATYNLLKGLAESGVETTYASINTKKHFVDPSTVEKEFKFLKAVHTHFINTDVSVVKVLINIFSSKSYNIDRFYNKSFENKLLELISSTPFDLIHFEGLFVAAYAPAIKKISKIPILLRQHNIEYNIWKTLSAETSSPVKKQYLKLLASKMEKFEKKIIHEFDSIVSITESDRLEVQKSGYRGPTTSIPAGIEVKPQDHGISIRHNTLYHIGSMEWMPNRQAMDWFHAEIWPLILQKQPEAEFYMAGKNMPDHYQHFEGKGFHVSGAVDNLDDFVADKSVLTVPLKSGSGIRIKTIEAMMAGKAVVTTSQGALGLPLKHLEHCLIADTELDFSNAVLQLLNDRSLRDTLAENGKRFANENFSNQAVSEKWKAFYIQLVK